MTKNILSVENTRFQLKIDALGGELNSLWDKKLQCEWIWQPKHDVWDRSAIQLFPVVGRLIHGGLWQGNKFFTLPNHGFLQDQPFVCTEKQPAVLVLEAAASTATLAYWPWRWRIVVSFELTNDGLIFHQKVINEDSESLWFSIGWHPGFALPLAEQAGWKVRFSNGTVNGPYFTRERTLAIPALLTETDTFILTDTSFCNGAIYFGNSQNQHIQVCSPEERTVVEMDTGEHDWLALWSVPGANLLCIEPLSGTTDAPDFDGLINHRRGIQQLAPGQNRIFSVRLRFPSGAQATRFDCSPP